QAEKAMQSGDWTQAFDRYDLALKGDPTDDVAKAGREDARRHLIGAVIADLDRALTEVDKSRQELEACRRKPKPQTLDEEQHQADARREAEDKVVQSEKRVRAIRDQAQRILSMGEK